jgi:hypothetical protein
MRIVVNDRPLNHRSHSMRSHIFRRFSRPAVDFPLLVSFCSSWTAISRRRMASDRTELIFMRMMVDWRLTLRDWMEGFRDLTELRISRIWNWDWWSHRRIRFLEERFCWLLNRFVGQPLGDVQEKVTRKCQKMSSEAQKVENRINEEVFRDFTKTIER